jgi:hypothetical protein
MMPGLLAYYLPNLPDDQLQELRALNLHAYDRAPRLHAWLDGVLTGEAARRVRSSTAHCVAPEVELARVPCDWSDADLADALLSTTVISYLTWPVTVAVFIDELTTTIAALAAARLARKGACPR